MHLHKTINKLQNLLILKSKHFHPLILKSINYVHFLKK